MPITNIAAHSSAGVSVAQLRASYATGFRIAAPRFVMTKKRALHKALEGAVSDDVQCQISRLLKPLLSAVALTDELRRDLDDAARVIASIARVHRRDIVIGRACADALTGIGRLIEIGEIAAGLVDPPEPRAA
ncbi:hypothetical protein [Rubrimonas cliftonensis]|uniref:Uncharacterized protein n=1 Tax=Rubrimonas cliftonensis TaxID=89524 RepID=A0A1H4FYM5_9RHOB|nr:hypothetical protein [Rubrimonas cliftonensis]SEB02221.1 hypothetical protein SAMN05444370_13115 [Rubrimonas cliftonensis]